MTDTLPVVPAVNIDANKMASLAREIAINIRELKDILPDYKLTQEQFDQYVTTNEYFKKALQALTLEWNSAESTKERMRLQAAAGLEAALPVLAARMLDPEQDLGKVNETAKVFSKLAGVDTGGGGNEGGKVTIQIDLGGDAKLRFEKDITPTAAPGEAGSVSKITKGTRDA